VGSARTFRAGRPSEDGRSSKLRRSRFSASRSATGRLASNGETTSSRTDTCEETSVVAATTCSARGAGPNSQRVSRSAKSITSGRLSGAFAVACSYLEIGKPRLIRLHHLTLGSDGIGHRQNARASQLFSSRGSATNPTRRAADLDLGSVKQAGNPAGSVHELPDQGGDYSAIHDHDEARRCAQCCDGNRGAQHDRPLQCPREHA
jgi:hypothetical protein